VGEAMSWLLGLALKFQDEFDASRMSLRRRAMHQAAPHARPCPSVRRRSSARRGCR